MNLLEVFKDSEDVLEYSAGKVIAVEGEKGDHMYVVMKGEVAISIRDRTLAIALPGEIVGEMALINSNVRSATITARTDCRLALIDQASFNALMRHVPDFSLYVMKVLAGRLKHAYDVIGF
ncbi:MAG: cyclic nucleotide-binding domain-containing protein [Lysobacterales bacterium]